MELRWYILQCKTNCENKVANDIKELVTEKNIADLIAEIHVPEEELKNNVNGKTRIIKKRLYPGYVLIKMIANEKTISLLCAQKNVSGFAGVSKFKPSALTEKEALEMIGQKTQSNTALYKEGDSVNIQKGPFSGFPGKIISVHKEKLVVQLSIFGRSTSVDVSPTDLLK
jgi:transcriptional antiterminator NusG